MRNYRLEILKDRRLAKDQGKWREEQEQTLLSTCLQRLFDRCLAQILLLPYKNPSYELPLLHLRLILPQDTNRVHRQDGGNHQY
jgi:hypothetical protein